MDTVRAQGILADSYLAAIIRPVREGGYWVQNNGILVSPTVSIPIRVHFGVQGVYHSYIGVTYDRELFEQGNRFDRLPTADLAGKLEYWVGPLEVTH